MAGIIFLRTAKFDEVRAFYTEAIGMSVWLEQPATPATRTARTPPAVLLSEPGKENGTTLPAVLPSCPAGQPSCPQTCAPQTGAQHLEQPSIAILRHGNMLIGFHQQPQADLDGLITFFYETREEVDRMYARLRNAATSEPRENPRYQIYHFYGRDPEGRKIEFQQFLHPVPPVADAGT